MLTKTEDHRREDILRTARRHFLAKGYANTGMEPIAREAQVSTATLYGLYPGKDELFQAVVEHASEDFLQRMGRVQIPPGSAREQLTTFAYTYAAFMADPYVRQVFRLVMAERRRFEPLSRRFFDKGRKDFGLALMQVLAQLTAAGELRVPKPAWAAGQLLGMIEHPIIFVPLVTGDEVRPQRAVEAIADDAVETFLARYGAAQG
ncbi:MAG: TetR/AcrR family transcriptional regulator [Brevundimonas sp.]